MREAAEHLYRDRVVGEALLEITEHLLAQDRRGQHDGDLFAVEDGLHGGAQGHLGLAKADVAANEPVHRLGPLHVALGLVDGGELVRRFAEGKGVLKGVLPGLVGGKGVAGPGVALGLEREELRGQVEGGPLGGAAGLVPGVGAEAAKLGGALGQADVTAQQVALVEANVQGDALVELQRDDLLLLAAGIEALKPPEDAHPVLEVDEVVALASSEKSNNWSTCWRSGSLRRRRLT